MSVLTQLRVPACGSLITHINTERYRNHLIATKTSWLPRASNPVAPTQVMHQELVPLLDINTGLQIKHKFGQGLK